MVVASYEKSHKQSDGPSSQVTQQAEVTLTVPSLCQSPPVSPSARSLPGGLATRVHQHGCPNYTSLSDLRPERQSMFLA